MKTSTHKIVPHLWYDTEAKDAAEFYVDAFGGDSKITSVRTIRDTPSGDAEIVSFRLLDLDFMSISAGPFFQFNPSISFFVNFDPSRDDRARENLDALWEKLSTGGKILMPLDQYPFSEHYGWLEDRYGISWQLILTNPEGEIRPIIIPSLLFTDDLNGKAEEAMNYYTGVFGNSKTGNIFRYAPDSIPGMDGLVMFEDFMINDLWFGAMDSPQKHNFTFNESISFLVHCDTQEEIDYYWEHLSASPDAEQCGWCKDRFGISWQIVPSIMDEMMGGTPEQQSRVTEAFLRMKKFDIAELEKAYRAE